MKLLIAHKIPMLARSYIGLALCLFFISDVFGQIAQNNLEIRFKNDNAGEISNLLNTGDDLGETHSMFISVNLLKIDSVYNFKFKIESTEFSALNNITPEPRDMFFTEVNNIRVAIDNNKLKNNSFFFSCALGLLYIQGNKITIGATGQKYNFHIWLNTVYQKKYWIYLNSPAKDRYIPYVELNYGKNKLLFKKAHSSLLMINNLECKIASKFNFTGIGAKTYFDLNFKNEKYRMHSMDFEMEAYYLTNVIQYQTSYFQIGAKFNFKHFATYMQINKPIQKYLDNPFIKYDDMELLFNYGLVFIFK